MSQPAVSQAVGRLENQLGVQLFFRTPKGVRLTPAGQLLLPFVERAYHLLINGEKKLAELRSLEAGEVRIGASDTLCKYYLLPHLETFHARYPDVRIHVTNRTTFETVGLLKQGRVDFGVVSSPLNDDELQILPGPEIHDTFVVGEALKRLTDGPVSISELVAYPLLLLERGSNMRAFIDDWAQQHDVELVPDIELGSLDLLVQFASIGLGVAHVIRDFAVNELARGEVMEVQIAEPIPARHLAVTLLANTPLSPAATTFIELLDPDFQAQSG